MIRGLGRLGGHVRIRVRTADAAGFLNQAVAQGLHVSNVVRTPEGLRGVLPVGEARVWLQIARGRRERARIEGSSPAAAFQRRARIRPGLLAGLLTALLMVGYVTPRIWLIEVRGAPNLTVESQALAAADTAGVYAGALRDQIGIGQVERKVLGAVPGLLAVGLTVRGVLALLRLYPMTPPPEAAAATRLVADRDATVVAVRVFLGVGRVSPGDRVRRGQTLITGTTPASHGRRIQAAAAGEVLGAVPLVVQRRWPYQVVREVPTGRQATATWLVWNGLAVPLSGMRPLPFAVYTESVTTRPLTWAGVRLPGRIIAVVYNEMKRESRRIGGVALMEKARAEMRQELDRLAGGAPLYNRRIRVVATRDGVAVEGRALMVVNIAVPPTKDGRRTGGGS